MNKELTNTSSFQKMISENFIYVDKTEYIYNLFNGGISYYFLSRPRRFGKTLLISTLKEMFSGNRELFKDLKISKLPYDWKEYPVIHLDFSIIANNTPDALRSSMSRNFYKIAEEYKIDIDKNNVVLKDIFVALIAELSKKNRVVLLIDEYDKPILDNIDDINIADENRKILKECYDALKGMDDNLHAIFVTGVTKFAKTSIFSGLNNLDDITFNPVASTLLGYTEEEIKNNFEYFIDEISKKESKNKDEILSNMKSWYNGYRFSSKEIRVYNPHSILYYFRNKVIRNYWFESGTPTFLISLVKSQFHSLQNLNTSEVDLDSLGTFNIDAIPLVPLLLQTGYLTIDYYNESNNSVTLNFPNLEVEQSFNKFLVGAIAQFSSYDVSSISFQLKNALNQKNLDKFFEILKTLYAHVPYTILDAKEKDYHVLFQNIMSLFVSSKDIKVYSEKLTNIGRIDAVIETKSYVYIFEFKADVSSDKALKQIHDKQYYLPYKLDNKPIILIGLNFRFNPFDIEYKVEML